LKKLADEDVDEMVEKMTSKNQSYVVKAKIFLA